MKITPRKYAQALAETLESGADPRATIKNMLLLLQRRKQFRALPKVLKAFEEIWNTQQGIVKVEIFYPEKFEASVKELEEMLSAKLGKKLSAESKKTEGLIGGFKVLAGDTLIDASIAGKLKLLEKKLMH